MLAAPLVPPRNARLSICSPRPPPQDLQHATALCEVVYYTEEESKVELRRLNALLGLERPLSDVRLFDAAGQR